MDGDTGVPEKSKKSEWTKIIPKLDAAFQENHLPPIEPALQGKKLLPPVSQASLQGNTLPPIETASQQGEKLSDTRFNVCFFVH